MKKGAVWGRDLVIANPKKKSRSKWYQSIQNFLENKIGKKKFEKRCRVGAPFSDCQSKKKVALGEVPIESEFPGEQNGQKKF